MTEVSAIARLKIHEGKLEEFKRLASLRALGADWMWAPLGSVPTTPGVHRVETHRQRRGCGRSGRGFDGQVTSFSTLRCRAARDHKATHDCLASPGCARD